MIPTRRLLGLLLLGSVVVAGASFAQPLTWLAVLYVIALFGFVTADVLLTTRPEQIEVARVVEPKLSLGADNAVALVIVNRSPRPLRAVVRDEYPHQFDTDAIFLDGKVPALGETELRYHVRPLNRGDYTFGAVNL